jgi:hypothetical protein
MKKINSKYVDLYELDTDKTYVVVLKCCIQQMPLLAKSIKEQLSNIHINNVIVLPKELVTIKEKKD